MQGLFLARSNKLIKCYKNVFRMKKMNEGNYLLISGIIPEQFANFSSADLFLLLAVSKTYSHHSIAAQYCLLYHIEYSDYSNLLYFIIDLW